VWAVGSYRFLETPSACCVPKRYIYSSERLRSVGMELVLNYSRNRISDVSVSLPAVFCQSSRTSGTWSVISGRVQFR
jgi:hypothetical protein